MTNENTKRNDKVPGFDSMQQGFKELWIRFANYLAPQPGGRR